jgi:hypothetical protein
MSAHTLHWDHGTATVLTTAAMLAECRFILNGKAFSPFARAPWMGTIDDMTIIGHLRELGGDFPCLPFGSGGPRPGVAPEWSQLMQQPALLPIHGPAADRDWTILEASPSRIRLALDYPDSALIERVERVVAVRPDAPALDCSFDILPRRNGTISAGLHPILRLPEQPGRLALAAQFAFGLVHPTQALVGQGAFSDLSAVPQAGGDVDMGHVPLAAIANLNVQLCGMAGPITATYLDEGAGVILDWDRTLLPSLQIWHTDRGINGAPWHGQYRGIGLEPIAAAFDFHDSVSTGPNPINARGVPTAITLEQGQWTTIRHSITAFSAQEGAS